MRHLVDNAVSHLESVPDARLLDSNFQSAYQLMSSESARDAFDLSKEDDKTKERYGRNRFGMSCLLARRMIERGVRFVTVNMFETVFNEITWDIHGSAPFSPISCYRDLVGPMFDHAYSSLLEDLHDRGLLQNTLVLAMGEFGRTPKVNPAGGRDHWTNCWTTLIGGGGIKGGQVIGASDEIGGVSEGPADRAARRRRDDLQGARHRHRDGDRRRGEPAGAGRRLRPSSDQPSCSDACGRIPTWPSAARALLALAVVVVLSRRAPRAPKAAHAAPAALEILPERDRPARAGQPSAAHRGGPRRHDVHRATGRARPRSRPRTRTSPPWTPPASSRRSATDGPSSPRATATGAASTVVEVERASAPYPPTFRNHVIPVLTRAGCNSGPCHGSLSGKNGFKLTLRGYDPEVDYLTLTRQAAARRINKVEPGAA